MPTDYSNFLQPDKVHFNPGPPEGVIQQVAENLDRIAGLLKDTQTLLAEFINISTSVTVAPGGVTYKQVKPGEAFLVYQSPDGQPPKEVQLLPMNPAHAVLLTNDLPMVETPRVSDLPGSKTGRVIPVANLTLREIRIGAPVNPPAGTDDQ